MREYLVIGYAIYKLDQSTITTRMNDVHTKAIGQFFFARN